MSRRRRIVLLVLLWLPVCTGPIVNEDYGGFGRESINGVDAFYGLLEGENRKVVRSPYLTRKIMETADIIIYFPDEQVDPEHLARLESFLHNLPYRPPQGEPGIIDPAEARRRPSGRLLPALQETVPDEDSELFDEEAEDPASEDEVSPEDYEEDAENEELSMEESEEAAEELLPPERDLPVTLLYFLRDTDASVPFWDSLRIQMEGHQEEEAFARANLELRLKMREEVPEHLEILFGTRKMLDAAGRPLRNIWVHPLLHDEVVPEFPVRFVPDPPRSLYEEVQLSARTLMETRQGYDLMREFFVEQGRVIVSYNSEWALNYSMVRGSNRALAESLIDYALNLHSSSDPVRIYWITGSLRGPGAAQAEEEGLSRIFEVFPLNVILFQVVFLLALFLLSRWPHEKRPLKETARGKREFMEHMRFLGMKLRRSKNPFDALEPLGAYVKRKSYDPDQWEAAIAGLFARGGESGKPRPEAQSSQTQDKNS